MLNIVRYLRDRIWADLVFIFRHRLPLIIFILAAVIGGVLIFWYINGKDAEAVCRKSHWT